MHQCGRYIEGKANSKTKDTAHDLIEGATIQMPNEVFIDNLDIVSTIKSIIKKNIIVTDEEKTIDGLLQKNEELQYMVSNLLDMKLKNKDLPESTYKQKYYELTEEITSNERMIKKLESDMLRTYDTKSRIELINTELKKRTSHLTELNDDSLHSFIYKMISVSPEEVVFCVAGKKNYDDKEFSEKRHDFLKNEPLAEGTYHDKNLKKDINYRIIVI